MSTAARSDRIEPSVARDRWGWWFAPYAMISLLHAILLASGAAPGAEATKLLLMPSLLIAVLASGPRRSRARALLIAALAMSWLGDGAGTLFPALPTVPLMLAFFGLAHATYIALFAGPLASRRLPVWSAVFALWWVALVIVLAPALLGLAGGPGWLIAVGGYGILLGLTAAQATRTRAMIAVGAAFFLTSDSVLAFRLFTPDAMPDWTSPLVMITYTLGQGLIAAGTVAILRRGGR